MPVPPPAQSEIAYPILTRKFKPIDLDAGVVFVGIPTIKGETCALLRVEGHEEMVCVRKDERVPKTTLKITAIDK